MSYIDATVAPLRKTGQIKIHDAAAFAGMRKAGRAEFPDCVSARAAKHMVELSAEVGRGARAVLVFLVQIGSAEGVGLARDIDPGYGVAFDRARLAGVETLALACRLSTEGIEVGKAIPVIG